MMKKILSITLLFFIIFLPVNNLLFGMPIPSSHPTQASVKHAPIHRGAYHYSYYDRDPIFLFLETALYVALMVSALIVLDENLDNITIIIQD